jgi:hypothetical protein
MALNAKTAAGGGSNFEPLEAGTYPARLVQVVDLGLQEQRPWQGKDKPPANEIMLTYELVDEFLKDEDGEEIKDKPRWVSERFVLFNLEAERAKSTARYLALDPEVEKDGDFAALIDTPCNVTVVQSPGKGKNAGRVYANVGGVTAMRKKDADACPALVNPALVFDLDDPTDVIWRALNEWVQKIIISNLEYEGSALQQIVAETPDPAEDGDDETPY